MKIKLTEFYAKNKVFIIGVELCIIFWAIGSSVDAFVFEGDESFFESFVSPDPVEFWMRGVVIVLLMFSSFYAKYLLSRQQRLIDELDTHKNNLESLVKQRTEELYKKNRVLEDEVCERKQAEQKLELLATTDPLTMIFNRRKFDELLRYEIDRDRRYQHGLSLIMCDIDHFKKINDQYGHHIGDKVLIEFVDNVQKVIRKTDVFARWGGEEFVILIPSVGTDITLTVAEKVRNSVENAKYSIDSKVTASFGVSVLLKNEEDEGLVKRADSALYRAKEKGRNRVELAANLTM